MISIAPTPFIHVIGSPNKKNEISNANNKAVPLNMKAVETGILLIICCQRMAYSPNTSTSPHTFRMYPTLRNGHIAADLEKNEEQAYTIYTPIKLIT